MIPGSKRRLSFQHSSISGHELCRIRDDVLAELGGMTTKVASSPLLTVAEVATRLRVSERTVRRLIAADLLPSIQLNGPRSPIRISERELHEWLFDGPEEVA
jgi:excisionase family DNA binding protein